MSEKELKYETEINEFLDLFVESGRANDRTEALEVLNETSESLNEKFQIGVDNGFTARQQIDLIKSLERLRKHAEEDED